MIHRRPFRFYPVYFMLIVSCFCWTLNGCKHEAQHKQPGSRRLTIQPFGNIPSARVDFVFRSLSGHIPGITLLKPINLPATAYNAARQRYRADSIIEFLDRQTEDGTITIALTSRDISVTKGDVQDWGVMGLGFCPGKACVASSFRLSKTNTDEQLFKVAIHEIGHTEGLPHCEVTTCFMRDAEGKNRTDMLTAFCEKCKAHLVKKGWELL